MIRAGALSRAAGSAGSVSRNGPTTLVASVSSIPSADTRALVGQHAGVVDEHVEARSLISKASANCRTDSQLAEIADPHVHVVVTGPLDDPRARLLAALRGCGRPARPWRRDARSPQRRPDRAPSVAPVTSTTLPVHRAQLRRVPAAAADPVADVRVAGDHGPVEQRRRAASRSCAQREVGLRLRSERSGTCVRRSGDRGLASSSWTSQIRRSAKPASQ